MRKEEIGREPIEKDEHWDWRGRGERGCDGDQKEWWPSGGGKRKKRKINLIRCVHFHNTPVIP